MMRLRWMTTLLLGGLTSCSAQPNGQTYSVYFQPYSADIDQQALQTVHDAADFARAHHNLPIAVTGYSAPPDPDRDVPGLSAGRAAAVAHILASAGVESGRVTTSGNGIVDPKALPTVSVRRVDIIVGP
jgi:outer membrane protein OmpA-like peptidoglycan-associated protein